MSGYRRIARTTFPNGVVFESGIEDGQIVCRINGEIVSEIVFEKRLDFCGAGTRAAARAVVVDLLEGPGRFPCHCTGAEQSTSGPSGPALNSLHRDDRPFIRGVAVRAVAEIQTHIRQPDPEVIL